jgi:GT2 family glycosyltransferase
MPWPKVARAVFLSRPRIVGGNRGWPEVTIVIPTRDLADLLSECVKGLNEKTDYPRYRVVIMDNGSTEPDALALLSDLRRTPRFAVVDRPGPFNFSALSNEGARLTATPLLVFLNNDIEMIDANWLRPLVGWAMQPDIGVVGAKLLFPGGTIQHAGVVVGLGGIGGHMYRKQRSDARGYLGELKVPHEVTAVTAACIAIERAKFETIGGFDAENLPVELNDLDLCLRIAEHGWSNLWTPESVLCHHASASRLVGLSPSKAYRKERVYFTRRWQHIIRDDPHFHPGRIIVVLVSTGVGVTNEIRRGRRRAAMGELEIERFLATQLRHHTIPPSNWLRSCGEDCRASRTSSITLLKHFAKLRIGYVSAHKFLNQIIPYRSI